MAKFDLDQFVAQLRDAALQEDAARRVRALMTDAFRDPDRVGSAMSGFTGEEEILFEDDSVSIWYVGFDPGKHVPPHDHQIDATIGVYEGQEINHFYLPEAEGLQRKSSKQLGPGDVISLRPDTIHSVETANERWSYGIHVYLGPLTRTSRSLFDWDSGERIPADDDAFATLERPSFNQAQKLTDQEVST